MSEKTERRGQCLCGAVRFTAKNASNAVGACHCNMCRRWGGGPFMEIGGGADVAFEGEENIAIFDSSPWAERGFCKTCGSHLFYRIKQTGQQMIAVGLLDDDTGLAFRHQVFIDEKPKYYDFSNETENMTGAEIVAKFGVSS